jgi:adenylate cyclase
VEAIACVEKAFRLNPHLPGDYFWILGFAHYVAKQYEAAVKTLRNEATYRTGSRFDLAGALAQLGQLEEAREGAELYVAANPQFQDRPLARNDAQSRHRHARQGCRRLTQGRAAGVAATKL